MKVVVIIPTYNERENIIELLSKLDVIRKKIDNHAISFLIADDTSPDNTQVLVNQFAQSHKDIYVVSGKKEGLGRALLRGMHFAVDKLGAEILTQMDADLSHDPGVFPQFLRAIDQGADFVVGSRYIPGGSIPGNWAFYRKVYSVIGNSFVRYGLGFPKVHDWTGGYRAYKRKYFDVSKEDLNNQRGYVFQIAFLYKSILHGAHITEIPIHFTDRKRGHSKIAPKEYIRDVFVYVTKSRWQRLVKGPFGKFLVVGGIGFLINTIILEIFVTMGFHPAMGSAVGAESAIISNFLLNNTWTFRHKQINGVRKISKFFQFNFTSLGAIIIQSGIVWFGTHSVGTQSYRIFYIFGVSISLIWNYIMYSRVIWKK